MEISEGNIFGIEDPSSFQQWGEKTKDLFLCATPDILQYTGLQGVGCAALGREAA